MDGGENNIPFAFLKKRGDKKQPIIQRVRHLESSIMIIQNILCHQLKIPILINFPIIKLSPTLVCCIAVKCASTTAAEGRQPRINIGICKLELLLVIFGSLIWLDSDDVTSFTLAKPGV